MTRLDKFESRLTRIEKLVWTVLGMLIAKAGIDVTPFVSALLG